MATKKAKQPPRERKPKVQAGRVTLVCHATPATAEQSTFNTAARFEEACKAGRALAERCAKALGGDWAAEVWENLGWHTKAIGFGGRIRVGRHTAKAATPPYDYYDASVIEPGETGSHWKCEYGDTPEQAVRRVVAKVKADVARYAAMVEGL